MEKMNKSKQEALDLLALSSIKGVGFQTLWNICESGRTFRDVLDLENTSEAAAILAKFGARIEANKETNWQTVSKQIQQRAQQVIEELERHGVTLLMQSHPSFPKSLFHLGDPPKWLFVQGDLNILSAASISVVGTREPSPQGKWLSKFVGLCLHQWRCPTVSGLAYGIDQEIHTASFNAGVPTIAVLGTGIFTDYPKNAGQFRKQIISNNGAIITEYLPWDTYSAQNFVRRNRIQAALGKALIPVEWKPQSGTAHTVRFATRLNRPIAFLKFPIGHFDITDEFGGKNGKVFSITGDEEAFRNFIAQALESEQLPPKKETKSDQPSLLDGL